MPFSLFIELAASIWTIPLSLKCVSLYTSYVQHTQCIGDIETVKLNAIGFNIIILKSNVTCSNHGYVMAGISKNNLCKIKQNIG